MCIASSTLVARKGEVASLKDDLQNQQTLLTKHKNQYEELKLKLIKVKSDALSMEAKAQELQELLHQEELKEKRLDRDLKLLKEIRKRF